jgi:hypothetical protein
MLAASSAPVVVPANSRTEPSGRVKRGMVGILCCTDVALNPPKLSEYNLFANGKMAKFQP